MLAASLSVTLMSLLITEETFEVDSSIFWTSSPMVSANSVYASPASLII